VPHCPTPLAAQRDFPQEKFHIKIQITRRHLSQLYSKVAICAACDLQIVLTRGLRGYFLTLRQGGDFQQAH
jgi:hypothetical protein